MPGTTFASCLLNFSNCFFMPAISLFSEALPEFNSSSCPAISCSSCFKFSFISARIFSCFCSSLRVFCSASVASRISLSSASYSRCVVMASMPFSPRSRAASASANSDFNCTIFVRTLSYSVFFSINSFFKRAKSSSCAESFFGDSSISRSIAYFSAKISCNFFSLSKISVICLLYLLYFIYHYRLNVYIIAQTA